MRCGRMTRAPACASGQGAATRRAVLPRISLRKSLFVQNGWVQYDWQPYEFLPVHRDRDREMGMEHAVQRDLINRLFTYLDTGTTAMAPEVGHKPRSEEHTSALKT